MQVSTNAWLLAAIAVPLTVLTVAIWILWVRHSKFNDPILPVYEERKELRACPRVSSLNCREEILPSDSRISTWTTLKESAKSIRSLPFGNMLERGKTLSSGTVKTGLPNLTKI